MRDRDRLREPPRGSETAVREELEPEREGLGDMSQHCQMLPVLAARAQCRPQQLRARTRL
ncbi:hypothetical protein JYU34_008320 [Plutella xylostella]|uniref:Uncharacterized protein n=1 Tax=Plutella xylostella TaxID=51655 RepID=A0ABQ7QP73_PLUXY|nr:hypothetical protein JYU34_008320 [Plutella xylostella]